MPNARLWRTCLCRPARSQDGHFSVVYGETSPEGICDATSTRQGSKLLSAPGFRTGGLPDRPTRSLSGGVREPGEPRPLRATDRRMAHRSSRTLLSTRGARRCPAIPDAPLRGHPSVPQFRSRVLRKGRSADEGVHGNAIRAPAAPQGVRIDSGARVRSPRAESRAPDDGGCRSQPGCGESSRQPDQAILQVGRQ